MARASLRGEVGSPWYRAAHAGFGFLGRLLCGLEVRGVENVPREGALLVACNHLSVVDPVFVGVSFPRQIRYMAKAELWESRSFGWILDRLGAFPVRRGHADREPVRTAFEHLSSGRVVGIFPEGHRQKSGRLGQAQPGVGMFSLRPGVITIPVGITGTDRITPGGVPRPAKVTVTIGPPIDVENLPESKAGRNREVSHRIMRAIAALLDQSWEPVDGVS